MGRVSFAAALRPFLLVLASDQSSCAVSQRRWGRHVHIRAAPRAQEAVNTSAIEPLLALRGTATNHDNEAIARATREQRQAGAGLLTNIAGVLLTIVALGSAVAVLLELVLPSRAAIKWLYSRWTGPSQLRAKATAKKAAARQRRRQVGAEAEAERVAAKVEAHHARADAAKAAATAATAAARARVEAARAEVEAAGAEVEAAMADAMRRSATLIAERDAERGAAPTETVSDYSPCVVCCDVEATHILAPCGHRAVCTGCARLIKECPLCRAPVLCVVGKVYAVN